MIADPTHMPGIVGIAAIRCSLLTPQLMLAALTGATALVPSEYTKLRFYGKPSLKWEGSYVNGQRQEKATLEFSTDEKIDEGVRWAFVVWTASGKNYLIGQREPRYPVVTYSETTGKVGDTPNLRSYKVTYVAQKAVVECAV